MGNLSRSSWWFLARILSPPQCDPDVSPVNSKGKDYGKNKNEEEACHSIKPIFVFIKKLLKSTTKSIKHHTDRSAITIRWISPITRCAFRLRTSSDAQEHPLNAFDIKQRRLSIILKAYGSMFQNIIWLLQDYRMFHCFG